MDVTIWAGTAKKQFGIRVGAQNRKRYFKPGWTAVEVELDGKLNRFALTPAFWCQCPEFRDAGHPTLKEWLARHELLEWPKGNPPALTLIPLDENRFRLLPE